MRIPAYLLRTSVTIENYLGESGSGPKYGEPYTAKCRFEKGTVLVKDKQGEDIVCRATVFFPYNVSPPEGSKVTTSTGTYVVAELAPVENLQSISFHQAILR